MKKLIISLFVIAAVTFSACGGSTKPAEAAATNTTEETTEVKASLVDQYEALINKNADLTKKVMAGDAEAIAEAEALGKEMVKFTEDNKEALEALSDADKVKLQEITTKAAQAAMEAMSAK